MNKLIKNYLDVVKMVESMQQRELKAEEAANAAELPEKLRPAEAKDIVEGAVIWYPKWKEDDCSDGRLWKIVVSVIYPSDRFKGYTAHEGCRYGLDGAFVEL